MSVLCGYSICEGKTAHKPKQKTFPHSQSKDKTLKYAHTQKTMSAAPTSASPALKLRITHRHPITATASSQPCARRCVCSQNQFSDEMTQKKHWSLSGLEGRAHGVPKNRPIWFTRWLSAWRVTYEKDSSNLVYACISSSVPCGHSWPITIYSIYTCLIYC